MLPGMELMGCTGLAVPPTVMEHVVKVESSFNPYAIGVVGGRLARQPRSLAEALSTARMLEERGYNFSLGLAQVNRYNLARQGLDSYEKAFDTCPNLRAGARILAECYGRSGGDWGKAFSCYYSGNFTTGYRHGYVQKVLASWQRKAGQEAVPIPIIDRRTAVQPRRAVVHVQQATAQAMAAGNAVPVVADHCHQPLAHMAERHFHLACPRVTGHIAERFAHHRGHLFGDLRIDRVEHPVEMQRGTEAQHPRRLVDQLVHHHAQGATRRTLAGQTENGGA